MYMDFYVDWLFNAFNSGKMRFVKSYFNYCLSDFLCYSNLWSKYWVSSFLSYSFSFSSLFSVFAVFALFSVLAVFVVFTVFTVFLVSHFECVLSCQDTFASIVLSIGDFEQFPLQELELKKCGVLQYIFGGWQTGCDSIKLFPHNFAYGFEFGAASPGMLAKR